MPKFALSNIKCPTPKSFRRLGDAMLAAGTVGAGFAFVNGNEKMTIICFALGVVGKFISELTKTDNEKNVDNRDRVRVRRKSKQL